MLEETFDLPPIVSCSMCETKVTPGLTAQRADSVEWLCSDPWCKLEWEMLNGQKALSEDQTQTQSDEEVTRGNQEEIDNATAVTA